MAEAQQSEPEKQLVTHPHNTQKSTNSHRSIQESTQRMNNGGVNQMQRERSFVRTSGQNMQVTGVCTLGLPCIYPRLKID